MAEFTSPNSKAEFDANFSQIKPTMTDNQAFYESSRCLFCYDAPCITACPTNIDIPLFIKQIHSSNSTGAAKTIFESNYFGNSCGKVCPTEVLCEGACVYNNQGVKPLEIGRLQSFATTKAIKEKKTFFEPGPANGKKVAVIGAGPGGIACASELRRNGCLVDIFEAKAKPSGLTIYGVAPYKITNEEILDEIEWLQNQLGFNIHYNHPIESKQQMEELEKSYDAIFLGIGLGGTSTLGIPGEDKENVLGAVEFVEDLRMKNHQVKISGKVIVLGGGNTAMDAASESSRMGAEEVILAYRRGKTEMGAYHFEYDLAKGVGVHGMFQVAPIEIVGNGKATGVRFAKTELKNGKVELIPGSEFTENCDWVIKATGQSKRKSFLSLIDGLITDNSGKIQVDANGQTGNKKYFAAGDAVSGGQEVVNAIANAKKAANAMTTFLGI